MKFFNTVIGVAGGCLLATACSSEPIQSVPDSHETYTREFIKNFGVPADDHNYAMAQTAGLKVTTSKGGHVIVAANVKGENYLFADLDVPAGTHAIPVTLPRSVKELQVVTDLGVHTVALDAVVDIDKAPLDSRGGIFDIDKPTPDSNLNLIIDDEGDYPYLYMNLLAASRPYGPSTSTVTREQPTVNKFISQYFTPGIESTHNTNINTIFDPEISKFSSASHETTFTCHNGELVYYIFPIYWRAGLDQKDFKVYVHSLNEGDYSIVREKIRLPFNDAGDDEAGKPFPYLTYWDQSSFPMNLKYLTPGKENQLTMGSFKSDDGSFTEAYPKAQVVSGKIKNMKLMSRGVKIRIKSSLLDPEQYPDIDPHYHPAFCLAVEHTGKDGKKSFSSSCPWYNTREWNGNYFDMSLNELYLAGAATKSISYPNIPAYIYDTQFYDYDRDGANFPYKPVDAVHNTNGGLETDGYAGHSWLRQIEAPAPDDKNYSKFQSSLPILLGFNSAPTQKGQTDDRDYCDVIFLITPHYERSVAWQYTYTKLHAYEWTIAAEDLGGTLDWDFNDVVFTFTDVIQNLKSANHMNSVAMATGPASFTSMRVITVTPKAAGGTMPVYITYTGKDLKPMPEMPAEGDIMYSEADKALSDYFATTTGEEGTFIIGTEVHKWLGAGSSTSPVNAGSSRTHSAKQSVQFVIPTDKDILEEDELGYLPGMSQGSAPNKPLFGFAILVDKDNTLNVDALADGGKGFVHMSDYTLGQDDYLIGVPDANGSAAPQMILVEGDWEWPREMINIMDAYPSFTDWVKNPDNDQWHKVKNDGKFTKK